MALFGLKVSAKSWRFLRFALVGSCGTIVNLLVLLALVHFGRVRPPIAFMVALEVSIISNFLLNHSYTFRQRIGWRATSPHDSLTQLLSKLLRYNLIALGGAAISFSVFYLAYRLGLHYVLSDLVAIAAATTWNYYMSVKIVWKLVDE